jgi:hypothetical protein
MDPEDLPEDVPDAEMGDLRQRFQVLEDDRKEAYEMTLWTLKRNQETVLQLKTENKDLRAQLQALSKQSQGDIKVKPEDMKEETRLRRRLDQVRSLANQRKSELETLQSKLREMEKDQKGTVANDDTPLMRMIRVMENRLDKAMIKYNEAQSIRKTYEQIVKRLKDERVGYDNQLAAIERSLKGKENDYQELLLLRHDAQHAKEMSEAELSRLTAQITVERRMRAKEVQDKSTAVQLRVDQTNKMELAEKKRSGLQEYQTNQMISKLSASIANEALSQHKTEEERQKILDYEEGFRRIKEATGVSDVNDVIQKFITQEDTYRNLEELRKEHQAKVDALNQKKLALKSEIEKARFLAGDTMSRKQMDEVESNVSRAQAKSEKSKQKYERINKILIEIKSGAEHLAEQLDGIKLEGQINLLVNEENLLDGLTQCEQKLEKVFREVRSSDVYLLMQSEKERVKNTGDMAATMASVLQAVHSTPSISYAAGLLEPGRMVNRRMQEKSEEESLSDDADLELDGPVKEREEIKRTVQSKLDKMNKSKSKRVKSAVPSSRRRA